MLEKSAVEGALSLVSVRRPVAGSKRYHRVECVHDDIARIVPARRCVVSGPPTEPSNGSRTGAAARAPYASRHTLPRPPSSVWT